MSRVAQSGTHGEWDPVRSSGSPQGSMNQIAKPYGLAVSAAPESGAYVDGAEEFNFNFYEGQSAAGFYDGRGDLVAKIAWDEEGIKGVVVRRDARGKGYATKLYDYVQDQTDANLYEIIGKSNDFTAKGKAFALGWLKHRQAIEAESGG